MKQLELLWHLQQIDLEIEELEKKLACNPQEARVEAARQELDGQVVSRKKLVEKMKETKRQQKRLELDLHQVTTKRNGLRDKLYSGTVANVRELETLEKKLGLVEKKQGVLEDSIIAFMESTEESEEQLQEEERQVCSREQVLVEQERILEETTKELKTELEQMRGKRKAAETRVENRFLEIYTLQSNRHHGQGIARVINDNCEGCRVFISSAQRGLLYNPRAMVYCENCGRLLVRFQAAPEQDETIKKSGETGGG